MKDAITVKKVAVGLIVAVLIVIPLYAEANINEQTFRYRSSVNITPTAENMTIGVDTGRNLDYGIVMAKNDVRKFVNISAPQKTLLTISAEGNISEMLEFDRSMYFEGRRTIEIALNTTAGKTGYFAGNVTMTARTADNRVAQRWLALRSRLY